MLVMKPISSHVDKLSKVLSDPSLSDKKRYEGLIPTKVRRVPQDFTH